MIDFYADGRPFQNYEPHGFDELRVKTRAAPESIKRSIDCYRRAQGLLPLWGLPERRSRKRPSGLVAVIGCASPGLSVPVAAALDGELVPERVAPSAFAASIQAAKAGTAAVELVDGHWIGAAVLARTADGSLTLHNNEHTGLVLRANLHVREHPEFLADVYAGRVGLSISFRPKRMSIVRERGRRVRVIHELELVDVAALRPHKNQGSPAYPAARLFAALADDEAGVRRARERAIRHALTAVYSPRGR